MSASNNKAENSCEDRGEDINEDYMVCARAMDGIIDGGDRPSPGQKRRFFCVGVMDHDGAVVVK